MEDLQKQLEALRNKVTTREANRTNESFSTKNGTEAILTTDEDDEQTLSLDYQGHLAEFRIVESRAIPVSFQDYKGLPETDPKMIAFLTKEAATVTATLNESKMLEEA